MTIGYMYQKRWRRKHPEKRYADRRKYYRKTAFAANSRQRWTLKEIEMVLEHRVSDSELAAEIGRSVQAIQLVRHRHGEVDG